MYWLPVTVPLTSTAGESIPGNYTKPAAFALDVVGGTSDVDTAQAKFSIIGDPLWSHDNIPINAMFGEPDSARPVFYFRKPVFLGRGARILADVLNIGGEPEKTLVYVGVQRDGKGPQVPHPLDAVTDEIMSIAAPFTSVVDEDWPGFSPERDYDFALYGLQTNLADATVRITDAEGRIWMNDYTPLWAMAGRSNSELPMQLLPRPYLIPAHSSLFVQFKNDGGEAAGTLWLYGQRLPRRAQG